MSTATRRRARPSARKPVTPPESQENGDKEAFDLEAEIKKAAPKKAAARNRGKRSEPDAPDPNQWASISTLAPERPYVTVDGERHAYRLLQDFGALEHREIQVYSDEFSRLLRHTDENGQPAEIGQEDEARYEELLEWLFDHVLMDPDKLRKQLAGTNPETDEPRLSGGIKYEIVTTFTEAPARAMQTMEALAQVLQARDPSL